MIKINKILSAILILSIFIVTCKTNSASINKQNQIRSSNGFDYTISESNESECIIVGYTGKKKSLSIPEKLNGKTVIQIGSIKQHKNIFLNSKVTEVFIPNTVKIIGHSAFNGFLYSTKLSNVNIGDNVITIGNNAFGSNMLTQIVIPNSVTTIGDYAFQGNMLTDIVIPDSVITIGAGAFDGRENNSTGGRFKFRYDTKLVTNRIRNVTFGKNVRSIGASAFVGNQITELNLPSSVNVIGTDAFAGNPIKSYTFNGRYQNANLNSLGYIFAVFISNDRKPGIYTKQNDNYFYNGNEIIPQVATLNIGGVVNLISINGRSPETYPNNLKKESRADLIRNMKGDLPYPSRIQNFYTGRVFLQPGSHTIEVVYIQGGRISNSIKYSTDSMIWEQKYLFEGFTYEVKSEELQENKLRFFIERSIPEQYSAYYASTPIENILNKNQKLSINMVHLNGGTFIMGSPSNESGRRDDEMQRKITLSSFSIGKYEVTQGEYKEVMGYDPSRSGSLHPIVNITWFDAIEFCNRLSQIEKLTPVYTITGRIPDTGYPIIDATVTVNWNNNGYRLPTESEWEYACRAGTTTAFNTGERISKNTGWYWDNSNLYFNNVGRLPANAWGLHDMHGNALEWCWDWYGAYSNEVHTDPRGVSTGVDRVVRGGSYESYWFETRSSFRYYGTPNGRGSVGFRVVRNAE